MKLRAAIALSLAVLTATPALAQTRGGDQDSLGPAWREQQDEARKGVQSGQLMPLAQVIALIARQNPGRQLDAGLEDGPGGPVYRVRWASTDRRRIDYLVDARTGAILRADGQ
jgi:uncharacterized membrane protein YkoI